MSLLFLRSCLLGEFISEFVYFPINSIINNFLDFPTEKIFNLFFSKSTIFTRFRSYFSNFFYLFPCC